jgi:uncharacterized membrane protein SpoIIM required for sporulation
MKKRILLFFVFLGAFTAAFSIGAQMQVPEEEAKIFLDEFNKLLDSLKGENFGLEIFMHNTEIALAMFIPGFGIVWGLFSALSTGYAFAALNTTKPILVNFPPAALIFATPFGLMELAAYSLAMSRSLILIISIIKRTPLKKQWKPIVIEISLVVGLLLAGGIIEAYMIDSFNSGQMPKIGTKN